MSGLVDYLTKPFELLYAHTSDETTSRSVYADTRSEGGVYSVTSTQSGASTYGAYESDRDEVIPGTVQPREVDAFDCEDPRTCPDCEPLSAD